MFKILTKKMKL